MFRNRRPYGSPGGYDTLTRNSLRVVNVWMDEYKVAAYILHLFSLFSSADQYILYILFKINVSGQNSYYFVSSYVRKN